MAKLVTIPEVEPIRLGHYTLEPVGIVVRGAPSYAEHVDVGDFIQRAHRASGFWLADWLRYGETRRDWAGRLSQAVDSTGINERTLMNIRAIGAIPVARRRPGVSFALHAEVAPLEPDEQSYWLEQAEENGWTRHELRKNIAASKRRKVIDGQAKLVGKYRVVYADPPWQYGDSTPTQSGALAKAEQHYPTLSIADICQLPVEAHTEANAVLFLWVPAPFLLQNPGPREVIEAWGFTYKSNIVWDKVLGNFGHYTHIRHEHVIVATRGHGLPDHPTPSPDSVLTVRRSDVHSEKPKEMRDLIQKLYDGPYLELFGRTPVQGWSVFGNDARLWKSRPA